MLIIDGDQGEGGGQVLRTALALSMCRLRPFRMINIRARRKNPGLQPQHLAAVHAAAAVAQAQVAGAEVGSATLEFAPVAIQSGTYEFHIGTAGSTTLVMQTILPALMLAAQPSSVRIEGGTHNPLAPSFEFFAQAFCPLLARMGPQLQAQLERPGFYPRGGGLLRVDIQPARALQPLVLTARGAIKSVTAEILLAHLPLHIAQRERTLLQAALSLTEEQIHIHADDSAYSPGNAISIFVRSEHLTEVFSAIGQRGLPAEAVASQVSHAVQTYLQADVAVGPHLADQLLLPLALAGAGEFLTLAPTLHTTTNLDVIRLFTDVSLTCEAVTATHWRIAIS